MEAAVIISILGTLGTLFSAVIAGMFNHLKTKSDNQLKSTETILKAQGDLIDKMSKQMETQATQIEHQSDEIAQQHTLIRSLYEKINELELVILSYKSKLGKSDQGN